MPVSLRPLQEKSSLLPVLECAACGTHAMDSDKGEGCTCGNEAMECEAVKTAQEGSMLESPVFVFWCQSCGKEASEHQSTCEFCNGQVQRVQRVLELDDDEGRFSMRNLREALADASLGQDVGTSAALLADSGLDAGVAAAHPSLAAELAKLGVPPAVQRALVNHGCVSLSQILAAVSEASFIERLELSPAAEVLLHRFRNLSPETGPSGKSHSKPGPLQEEPLRQRPRLEESTAVGKRPRPQSMTGVDESSSDSEEMLLEDSMMGDGS
mmetsp:Transcript_85603/g.151584  ORF Transcript_85603/g.151584 Transcript_85603/m.151584 type:complete len:269 (-) Transcript_85603:18-824(-)